MSQGPLSTLIEAFKPSVGGYRAGPAHPAGPIWKSQRVKLFGGVAALLAAAVILAYQVFGGPPTAEQMARTFTVKDSETGQVIVDFYAPVGAGIPWRNSSTGKNTLYPVEKCFWTKDNKAKAEPTYVILNELLKKPGPTICPDCGRKVDRYNPMPPMSLMNEALGIKNGDDK